jgi:hypothetical protein
MNSIDTYGYGTLHSWDRIMDQESADEERDALRAREAAARPHVYYEAEMRPGFCERCDHAHRLHKFGYSPAELAKREGK